MIGNLEPEENVMNQKNDDILEQLKSAIQKLNWDVEDDIRVEIGGVATSGIRQSESANAKWSKPFGTISYQNDAFIVIKNRSRSPVIPSQPMSTNTD